MTKKKNNVPEREREKKEKKEYYNMEGLPKLVIVTNY
jgi:hypothetical protein